MTESGLFAFGSGASAERRRCFRRASSTAQRAKTTKNHRVLERLKFFKILLAPLQEKVEKGIRHLRSIIFCRVRRSKPGGLGLAGVDMDLLLPGTKEMPMNTTKSIFRVLKITFGLKGRICTSSLVPLLLLLWIPPVSGAQAGAVLSTLHSFQPFPNVENPSGLVQGSDGSFYGTTLSGGTNGGSGSVFKISTNGALTALYSFTGTADGANPSAALVQGSDGSFYGTTQNGGTYYLGTVFKISTNGVLTTLHAFTGGNDGANPSAALVQGSDRNFYGTTLYGGGTCWYNNVSCGTVFKISTNGVLTTLYSFGSVQDTGGVPLDGAYPSAALVQGSDGSFYGTTQYGGTYFSGTVFKISPNGALTTLYSFTGTADGTPSAALVQGSDGSFYGTTQYGGAHTNQWGTGYGTVFKISANGVLTTMHSFTGGNDGAGPNGLVQGSDGNFYGTTSSGGTSGAGTVFKISTNGVLTSLYSFANGTNYGANPSAALVQGSDGSFYGTTQNGGTFGWGTVFKISPNGALTTLYSFGSVQDTNGVPLGGANPSAALVQGSDGSFYGTTQNGGTNGGWWGTVFKISPTGAYASLYSFTGGNDGGNPGAGLVQGSDGSFYGTTFGGGTNGGWWGTVFKISPNGALTTLHLFGSVQDTNGVPLDGANPSAALVQDSDGSFYGTTSSGGTNGGYGSVFKISTNGALTTLYSFTGTADGANPSAALVQGSDGSFYGTTDHQGTYYFGTVFKISANGVLTTLHAFTGGNDGTGPNGLVQGSDGSFYGTTEYNFWGEWWRGRGNGTVFKISPTGAYASLYSFTVYTNGSTVDGANPSAALVQGSDGNFYGTTEYGGVSGAGTVFRLTIVPQPQLTIIPSGPYMILTWPTNYNGFTLQSTTNLGPSAVWTPVSPKPVTIGSQNLVINTITGRQQFYRLSR
jgi:uncharacterized repeat protein (TIGR03803 family)